MEKKVAALRSEVKDWCQDSAAFEGALARSPALFEVILWRRVVLDEFHESEAWEYRVRQMLTSLGAVHKWGLSGTPPLRSAGAVAEVAALLGYTRPEKDGSIIARAVHHMGIHGSSPGNNSAKQFWENTENQAELKAVTQRFVNNHIRQNTSELIEQIAIVEHEEFVEFTCEERLIYRQMCHDQGIFDLEAGYNHIGMPAREELLKRCAHFDMGEVAESASSAVTRLGDGKREWVEKVEQQLWVETARARLFQMWDPAGKAVVRSATAQHADAKASIERVLSASVEEVESNLAKYIYEPARTSGVLVAAVCRETAMNQAMQVHVRTHAKNGELMLRPTVHLTQPVKEKFYYTNDRQRHAVVHAVARRAKHHEADNALSAMAVCEHACCMPIGEALSAGLSELVTVLDKAHRSLQFYNSQLNTLAHQADEEETECSVCLESMCDLSKTCILPCSHVFHTECCRAVLTKNPHCPECRAPVERAHIKSVVMELKPPEPKDEAAAPKEMSMAWKKNGSKLNAVAARLREIRRQDPTAKALVFVQWADLEAKVCRALKDHGVPYFHLGGDRSLRRFRRGDQLDRNDGAIMRNFQEDTSADAPFVLVLSLQRAAAGTNLTAANHVLFVHPMNAETVETAAAYERQALGRVRRIGQTREEVHVWRFVTKETVEEHICKLHRNAPELEIEEAAADPDAAGPAAGAARGSDEPAVAAS